MTIYKVINNNVVIVKEENGFEKIVMGRGIGYKKKSGDKIDEFSIEKTFTLSNQEIFNNLQEQIREIPIEHIELAEEIVSRARKKLNRELNELIYISLMDHIHTAILRVKEGINIKNFLLWEIKRFYSMEYEIGLEALDLIEDKFSIRLRDDEAGFIALHIVNASLEENEFQDIYEITEIMQEIARIIKYDFNVDFDTESIYYYRFITHLKFFAKRLITKNFYEGGVDKELLNLVKDKYSTAYATVEKIERFIELKYGHKLSGDEKIYLTIHIQRVIFNQ